MAEELDHRLQALLDKEEIREVTYRFARGVDRHDWELMRSCYHDDALDCHGLFDGLATEYVSWATENVPQLADATTHHVSNVLIELEGDVAFCESYVLAAHRYVRNDGRKADFLCGARYVDRFERRGGKWRIAKRQLVWEWVRDDVLEAEFDAVGIDPTALRFGEQSREDEVYGRIRGPMRPRDSADRSAMADGDAKPRADGPVEVTGALATDTGNRPGTNARRSGQPRSRAASP
jgi:ketosteroid isomerase-like protein